MNGQTIGRPLEVLLAEDNLGDVCLTVEALRSRHHRPDPVGRQYLPAAGADDFVSKANLTTDLLPAIRRVAQTVPPRQEPTDRPGSHGW